MDSSSDGSFAWTDASNDTIDSGAMVNDNMNKIQSEDESVSGKNYKKKLQEELFAHSHRVAENEYQPNPKVRKRELAEGNSESGHSELASSKKKKIKREPESDIDISATRHKTNGHNHSESHDSYDESYLDLKVKGEEQFASPLVKKKKKKNKSKKRKDSTCDESNHQESHLEGAAEDGSSFSSQYAEEPGANATNQVETDGQKTRIKNKKSSNRDPDECKDKGADRQKPQPDPSVNRSVSMNTLSDSVNRSPRISERIQFEEDESSEMETCQVQSNKPFTKSTKLQTFLKNNINLKPSNSELKNESVFTADDEIWIVRCPKDVDIDTFQNKDLMLEGKCKLKLNGQTYEGIMNNESANLSILSTELRNFVIKGLSVKGCLNLRKRIPKSHIHDEAMVSNQTSFIPLPETKSRHPLFGSNYRKAIKLPASVAERLRAPPAPPAPPARDKGSLQPQHRLLATLKAEPSPESSAKPEIENNRFDNSKKKKKKRKHTDPQEIVPKKKKRMKHDLESADAWESEQAIEENLFNF